MKQHRFVVDVNVGRLAKWLRVLGYDTVFPRDADDNDLVRIALREGRILVTRDAGFRLRRAVRLGQMRVVQIKDQDLNNQLRQLVRELGLEPKNGFSRCLVCNEALHSVAKEKVSDRLPTYVYQNHMVFVECSLCRRIYWRGTHWAAMRSQIEQEYREVS